MGRIIDQIRTSKLPSNMMQFAARGALQVPPAENIEILVHLAKHNRIFGELARITLAGWDEKACLAAASDPQTLPEVLDYFIAPDNLRPHLLPALLENPSVSESELDKLAISALRETIEAMLKSARVRSLGSVVQALQANPYLKKEEAEELSKLSGAPEAFAAEEEGAPAAETVESAPEAAASPEAAGGGVDDETVSAYLKEHAGEIAVEGDKPFQAVGGIVVSGHRLNC